MPASLAAENTDERIVRSRCRQRFAHACYPIGGVLRMARLRNARAPSGGHHQGWAAMKIAFGFWDGKPRLLRWYYRWRTG
jgi:hypothetical protein